MLFRSVIAAALFVAFFLQARHCFHDLSRRSLGELGFERDFSYLFLLVLSGATVIACFAALYHIELAWSQFDSYAVLALLGALTLEALLAAWWGNLDKLRTLEPTCVSLYVVNILAYLVLPTLARVLS